MSEAADDYSFVLAELGEGWRVILRPVGARYLLQRRCGSGAAPWREDAHSWSRRGLVRAITMRGLDVPKTVRRLPALARDARTREVSV
ncbi:hypothetical protein [Ancylobacter terrae]|uniref:hypothetical protein n=1 Tax=Ancylobacter sp. sgz301288 TaxID=3342077 RepID=UPI00385FDA67